MIIIIKQPDNEDYSGLNTIRELLVSGLTGVAILIYNLFNINKDKDKDPK